MPRLPDPTPSADPAGTRDDRGGLSRRGFLRRAAATGAVAAAGTLVAAPRASASPSPSTIALADHGAAGDGTTDDTAAIQSALNAARSGTTVLGDRSATYLVSATLSLPTDGVTLDLNGAAIQVGPRRASDSQLADNDTVLACVDRTDVRITGGTLPPAASSFRGSGMPYRIQIAGGSGCRVDSMSARCDGSAFAFVTGSGHRVDHNEIEAGSIVGADTTNLVIEANTLDDSPSDAITVNGFAGGGCSGTQYIGNVITGYGRIGIEDYCPDGPALSVAPVFRGNQISSPSPSNASGTGISAMATGATIAGNTITDARGWAIEATGLGTTITGNTLSWTEPSAAVADTTAIVVNTSDPDQPAPVLVHGNAITGAGSGIVMFGDCFHCPVTIAANAVTDPLCAGIVLVPAQRAGGVSVSGNTVAFTGAPWQNANRVGIKSADNAMLQGNRVTYTARTYAADAYDTPYFFVGNNVAMIANVGDGGGRTDSRVLSSSIGGTYTGWVLSANQFINGAEASLAGLTVAALSGDVGVTDSGAPAGSSQAAAPALPAPPPVATSASVPASTTGQRAGAPASSRAPARGSGAGRVTRASRHRAAHRRRHVAHHHARPRRRHRHR